MNGMGRGGMSLHRNTASNLCDPYHCYRYTLSEYQANLPRQTDMLITKVTYTAEYNYVLFLHLHW